MNFNVKENLRSLMILHAALVAGMVMISLIFYSLGPEKSEEGDPFFYILPVLVLSCLAASQFLFKKAMSTITKEDTLMAKFTTFRTASIIRYALLEGPGLISVVFFFLMGKPLYLAYTGLVLLILILTRPTKQSLVAELPLTNDERKLIENA